MTQTDDRLEEQPHIPAGKTPRLRFAPSPTGFQHIGGFRTALFSWLYARHTGGTFVLRVEDTDTARTVEGAVEFLIDGFHWLGIDYDEGPLVGGPFGPYYQTQRRALYQQYGHQLIASGYAYRCYCTPERLDQMRKEQVAHKLPPRYDRRCRYLSAAERAANDAAAIPWTVRLVTASLVGMDRTVEEAAQSLGADDQVALEATGPALAIKRIIEPLKETQRPC